MHFSVSYVMFTVLSLSRRQMHGSDPREQQPGHSGKDVFYFSVKNPHACSPRYIEMYYKKSQLIMRMLEIRIGQELMMQV